MRPSSPSPLLALVDGNNFFCSCERVFDPKLRFRPLIVLSNNDGCVISRSQEVKDLGIPMGIPFFKIKELISQHQIQIRSTNFPLYNEMSHRLMETLKRFAVKNEIYSIDESFLWIPSLPSPHTWATELRKKILQETGLPVSVGVAPTKVLAKLSNRFAKKRPSSEGVWIWENNPESESLLQTTSCEEIWGIGRKLSLFLKNNGIQTVAELMKTERLWIRENLHVTGERIWMELHRIPTLGFEENPQLQKSILCSRSFGKEVSSLQELQEAISTHLVSAAEKMRSQKTVAGMIHLFLAPNRWKQKKEKPMVTISHRLTSPNDYTPTFIEVGFKLLEKLYEPHQKYKKAGILLSHLQEKSTQQLHWFEESLQEEKQQRLMETMDRINRRWGAEKITLGSSGLNKTWSGKSSQRSPNYTTSWNELPQV